MLFGVDVSCRIMYSIISLICKLKRISYLGWGRELFFLLSFTCNYVVSDRRGFLFLLVLGMGCVILLWHSLAPSI